jgi:hypothetical protein
MPLNPTNQNKVGVLLPNPTAPRFDTAFAAGNREDFASGFFFEASGTPDPSFDVDTDISYIGAFRIPYSTSGSGDSFLNTRDTGAFAFDPTTGTVFLAKMSSTKGAISQWSVPELDANSTNPLDLPLSQKIQNIVNFDPLVNLTPKEGDSQRASTTRSMQYYDGKLYLSALSSYDTGSNSENIFVCNNPYDLASSTWQGFISTGNGDKGCGYSFEIPAEHQATFGNYTHIMGVGNPPSIASRFSFGNSILGWSPSDITDQTYDINTDIFVYYPANNVINGWSNSNEDVVSYYGSLVLPEGVSWGDYLKISPSERISDLSALPKPSKSTYKNMMMYETSARCGFIPPNSDTIVLIGEVKGAEYGNLYKAASLENNSKASGGFDPISDKDYRSVVWCLNINDISSAVDPSDVNPYIYKEFDSGRWQYWDESAKVLRGGIVNGSYDPSASRLYLLHHRMPHSQFEGSHIVSVYEVSQ